MDIMEKSVLNKFLNNNPNMGEMLDVVSLFKKIHMVYEGMDCKVDKPQAAKEVFKYVSSENDAAWCYVASTLSMSIQLLNNKAFEETNVDIDWEEVCKHCAELDGRMRQLAGIMKTTNTKKAFKELFYLVAKQNDANVDFILAEYILDAYGWDKVLKDAVFLYEEYLRLDDGVFENHDCEEVVPENIVSLCENEFEITIGGKVGGITDRMDKAAKHILKDTKFHLKKEHGKVVCEAVSYKDEPILYLPDAEEIVLKVLRRNIGLFKKNHEFSPQGFTKYATTLLRPIHSRGFNNEFKNKNI